MGDRVEFHPGAWARKGAHRVGIGVAWVALLAGCGAKNDPLREHKQALAQVANEALPPSWESQATVVIAKPMVDQLVSEAVTDVYRDLPERITRNVSGMEVRLVPRIRLERVEARLPEGCDSCLEVVQHLTGASGVYVETPGGDVSTTLRWSGTATMRLMVSLGESENGQRALVAVPTDEASWDLDLRMGDQRRGTGAIISAAVTEQIRKSVALGALQDRGPVRLRGFKVGPHADGLAIDLAFVAVNPGESQGALRRRADWCAAAPAQTVLALAQAVAVEQEPVRGYVAMPTGLSFFGTEFDLDLSFYPRGGGRMRDVRVRGTMGVEQGDTGPSLALRAEEAEWVGRGLKLDPMKWLGSNRILEGIVGSFDAAVPASHMTAIGNQTFAVKASQARAEQGQLVFCGDVERTREIVVPILPPPQ